MAMTPSIPSVRTKIAEELRRALNGNPAINVPIHINDFYRWYFDLDELVKLFERTDTKVINACEFDIERIEVEEDSERFRFFTTVQWKIMHYYAVKESTASSKLLSDQTEAILSTFAFNVPVFGIPERVEKAPRHIVQVVRGRIEKDPFNCWTSEYMLRTEHIEIKS